MAAWNEIAPNWNSEDFSETAGAQRPFEDFWDPQLAVNGTISPRAPTPQEATVALHPAMATDDVAMHDSPGGGWNHDDFNEATRRFVSIIDPWQHFPAKSPPISSTGVGAGSDFWDPLTVVARPPTSQGAFDDWSELFPFPAYDPLASENPFSSYVQEDTNDVLAEKRARWILSMLGLTNISRHLFLFSAFTDIFIEHPHHSTFRALSALVLEDTSAEDLLSAFALKQIWNDSPLFSSYRTRRRDVLIASNQSSLLGWTRAVRLIEQSRGVPAEQIINPDWYYDWLNVPYGDPLYWRFIDYVTARIDSVAAGALDIPPTTRRFNSPIKDVSIDGFSPFNSFSRTSFLTRGYTDGWVRGNQKQSRSETDKDAENQ